LVSLRYGREDELESDQLGFRFMTQAGYNPKGIVELMQVLALLDKVGNLQNFSAPILTPTIELNDCGV
jgi:predicted Zn-dependent protease